MVRGFYDKRVCTNAVPRSKFDLRPGKHIGVVVVPAAVAADVHGRGGVLFQTDFAGLRVDRLDLQRRGVDTVGMNGAGRDIRTVDGGLARRAEGGDGHITGEVNGVCHQLDGPVGHGKIGSGRAGLHQPADLVCRLRDQGDVALCRLDTGLEAVYGLCQGRNGPFRIFDSRIEAADRLGQRGYCALGVFNARIKTAHGLRERREIAVHGLDAG